MTNQLTNQPKEKQMTNLTNKQKLHAYYEKAHIEGHYDGSKSGMMKIQGLCYGRKNGDWKTISEYSKSELLMIIEDQKQLIEKYGKSQKNILFKNRLIEVIKEEIAKREKEEKEAKVWIELLFANYYTITENLNLELKEDFEYLQEELQAVFENIKYNHINDLMYSDFEDITETSNRALKKLIRDYQIMTDYTIITEDMFNAVTSKYEIECSTLTSKYDLTYKRHLKNSHTFKYKGNQYIHKDQMI